ncbi:DUF4231 domain-containing protein [Bariatricus sp. SGI.161]|uniref:DUF4231 domain-containing protein n=1 Tax=Bariatricus sp. SGI.161 TaxID=3420550 RepID=UPI003D085290
MNIEQYIEERLDPQIQWYSKKSSINQKRYKISQIFEIVLATLIPLLSSYSDIKLIAFIVGLFGSIIAIIESISKLYKFHENWIQYRTTAEMLKHEKFLFLTHSAHYQISEDTIESIFIQNIEDILSSESKNWNQLNTKDESLKNS